MRFYDCIKLVPESFSLDHDTGIKVPSWLVGHTYARDQLRRPATTITYS